MGLPIKVKIPLFWRNPRWAGKFGIVKKIEEEMVFVEIEGTELLFFKNEIIFI